MLVPVECNGVSKWVRVPQAEDEYNYSQFLQAVLAKFNLPGSTSLSLKDSSNVEVDSDIFDELLKSSGVSFRAEECNGSNAEVEFSEGSSLSDWSPSPSRASQGSSPSGSDSTLILESTKARKRQLVEGPLDSNVARNNVRVALYSKPGGKEIFKEYEKTSTISDVTRRKMVNILVADMVESHGRVPPVNVRILYALGITTLFPKLKDPDSQNGYEHFYDHQSGSGYLAWRLKTVQRNSAQDSKKSRTNFQEGPKTPRSIHSDEKQLTGDECREAISVMKHSSNTTLVKNKMKATFQHRQKVVQDPDTASTVLDLFPRFLDTPGLIDQDFTMIFGEEVSGKFLSKWPTFFKPRVIADCCKNLTTSPHVDELLLSAQQESDDSVWHSEEWDSEMAAILLLLHLLPPTVKGKKAGKMSASEAVRRLIKFMKVGSSMETFLKETGPKQPFLLGVGERSNSIQDFYVILDQKAIPCRMQTPVAAFDELFKAHYAFALSYDDALSSFFIFIQTTMYGIDVGKVKESPRVKEIRARVLHCEV
ncbi:uncharacterized protein LOC133018968 [Limanda limanda]|uniref:uncharacterized protein LOC132995794 n=1 Tax=Limanda limanda TaxID=27771 RepID=UPI0029C64D04|nr:uncharacterized protein LOC132995794 [Limanda limanda]XP_060941292.1 uncharacterized protein LOC133018968 [Limanda limanda]